VLAVPTTKMFVNEAEKVGTVVVSGELGELKEEVGGAFKAGKAVVAGSELLSKERVGGVEPGWIGELADLADVVLVEADGGRRRPLKGTAEHEPLVPEVATLVVAVGGVWALGEPLSEECVHRPDIFSDLTGVEAGHSITPESFASALSRGSLAGVPEGVRKAALLTGVEPGQRMSQASVVARHLWRDGINRVVLGSLPQESPGQVWVP
jgi:probable selenium-dependent hydroxylase accessory protein YqeC